jgi:hypothetical protein
MATWVMSYLTDSLSNSNLQLALPYDHALTLVDLLHCLIHKFVNDLLRRELLCDHRRSLAHQEWSCVVHHVIGHIIAHCLKVVLHGNGALVREVLDLRLSVILPVLDILIAANAERSASEDDGPNIVVKSSSADGLLVRLGRASLLGENKSSTDPDARGAEHERSGKGLAVEQTTGGDALDRLLGERRNGFGAHGGDGGDQNGGGDITSVATSLASLSADDIDAEVEAFLNVLGVADHVHVEDAIGVELVDNSLRRHADGGNEE